MLTVLSFEPLQIQLSRALVGFAPQAWAELNWRLLLYQCTNTTLHTIKSNLTHQNCWQFTNASAHEIHPSQVSYQTHPPLFTQAIMYTHTCTHVNRHVDTHKHSQTQTHGLVLKLILRYPGNVHMRIHICTHAHKNLYPYTHSEEQQGSYRILQAKRGMFLISMACSSPLDFGLCGCS